MTTSKKRTNGEQEITSIQIKLTALNIWWNCNYWTSILQWSLKKIKGLELKN